MNLLLSAVGDWFAQNWMLLVLVVVLGFFVVTTFLKTRKEANARNDLMSSVKKGTKIVTTAGVYGTVESIEETTDGKVVTIKTGSSKSPCTMTIHMNAIMGIDNKTAVKKEKEEVVEVAEEIADDDVEEEVVVVKKKRPSKKATEETSEEE